MHPLAPVFLVPNSSSFTDLHVDNEARSQRRTNAKRHETQGIEGIPLMEATAALVKGPH